MKEKKKPNKAYSSLSFVQRELLQKYNLLKHANPSKAGKFLEWMKSVIAWKKGQGRKPPNVRFGVIGGNKDRHSA